MADDAPRLLIRVKRSLDAEPIPELLVEQGEPPPKSKRVRLGASGAALRLVDTVTPSCWSFEDGLPVSWLHAAASAEWGPARQLPLLEPSETWPILRESSRRTVSAEVGEAVQLIDVEPVLEPSKKLAAGMAPPQFTVDGQPLLTATTPLYSGGLSGPAHEVKLANADEFVWDVYAMSEQCANAQFGIGGALVWIDPLSALDAEDAHDLEDIDDSQSDRSGGGPVVHCGPDSSDEGDSDYLALAGPPELPWVDGLD